MQILSIKNKCGEDNISMYISSTVFSLTGISSCLRLNNMSYKIKTLDSSTLNSPEAVEFYQRLGYVSFGVLDNFPRNNQRTFLRKIL